jgi:hypothetical protein
VDTHGGRVVAIAAAIWLDQRESRIRRALEERLPQVVVRR